MSEASHLTKPSQLLHRGVRQLLNLGCVPHIVNRDAVKRMDTPISTEHTAYLVCVHFGLLENRVALRDSLDSSPPKSTSRNAFFQRAR